MMNPEKPRKFTSVKVIWLSGLIIAFVVHAIGLLLFQVENDAVEISQADYSFASLPSNREAQGDLLREQARFFDSAPLFLPTSWNAASSPEVRGLRERPVELFDSFPARLSYGEADFGLGAIVRVESESPLQSLRAFRDPIHSGFGRVQVVQPELSPRFAHFEVTDTRGGEVVMRASVPSEGAPVIQTRLWAPALFLLHVEAVGLVGQPVLLSGSGVDEVDQFLRASLRRITRERMLDAGYYRVWVGP